MSTESTPLIAKPSVSKALYVSHFLSTWNARVLEYGAVLFLAELAPNTFLPLSLYALFRSLSAVLLSHRLGVYIDTSNRLSVVRSSIVYQRFAVVVTCFLFWLMTFTPTGTPSPEFSILLACLIMFACVERLCATMNMVSVERDWVVVIANGDGALLRSLNARMRRIDLFCKLIGPLAISYIDAWFNLVTVVWLLLVWNFVSMFVEYSTIAKVYRAYPLLQKPKVIQEDQVPPQATTLSPFAWVYNNVLKSFVFYIRHPLFLPSFSISLLYMTVLSFGPQMIAFLLFEGQGPVEVGLMRTASVIVELATTFLAPQVLKRKGPISSGVGFVVWQALCLSTAVYFSYPLLASGANASTGALYLIVGVIFSRIGLWGFDLSVQLIVQEGVEASHRAVFSSVEAATQSLFELLSFAQTIVWATPETFKYPVLASTGATVLAASLFIVYAGKSRRLSRILE